MEGFEGGPDLVENQSMITQKANDVRAVIFDVSGTVLDFGCRGPVEAFKKLFARHGVTISTEEARGPMGTHKRDHIQMLLDDPAISARWEAANGTRPDAPLLDRLCAEFAPLLTQLLPQYSELIAGVPETIAELRRRQIKIGSTTGFESGMIREVIPQAERAGFTPEVWVCPDHVGKGRPAPWMMFHAARQMEVYPLHTFVKVGDTPADIAEGHAAGAWVVSVVLSGNEVGHSETELDRMDPAERERKILSAHAKLSAGRPHYLIDTVADLMPVIAEISGRIAHGERPPAPAVTTPVSFAAAECALSAA